MLSTIPQFGTFNIDHTINIYLYLWTPYKTTQVYFVSSEAQTHPARNDKIQGFIILDRTFIIKVTQTLDRTLLG
jgi:hypothetical protein